MSTLYLNFVGEYDPFFELKVYTFLVLMNSATKVQGILLFGSWPLGILSGFRLWGLGVSGLRFRVWG